LIVQKHYIFIITAPLSQVWLNVSFSMKEFQSGMFL